MPTRDASQLSFALPPKLCMSPPKAPTAPTSCACCVSLNASGELSPGAAGFGSRNLCSLFLSPSVLGWISFNFSCTVSASKYLFKLRLGPLVFLSSLLQVRRHHPLPTSFSSTNPTPLKPHHPADSEGAFPAPYVCRLFMSAVHSGPRSVVAEQTL